MSQLTYSEQAPAAFAGLLADPNIDAHIRSYANEDVADAVFGLGYAYGTDPEKQFKAFAGGVGAFVGVLAHRHTLQQRGLFTTGGAGGAAAIAKGEPGDIVTKGRVWVTTNEAVTAGDAAYVVNTGADVGKFRQDATNAVAVTGVFRSTVAAAGLALLELNAP
jgi:hypothetical protein